MAIKMTDEQLSIGAAIYGISMEEARRRNEVMIAHKDDPDDPICIGCCKRPAEDPTYVMFAEEEDISPAEYVKHNEGTFNWNNGHYLCDDCYIKNGQPSAPGRGWKCP